MAIINHSSTSFNSGLGSVLTTISGKRLAHGPDSGTATHYTTPVLSASDYSPFGAPLHGRTWSGGYRYGFQGQEMDDEVKGAGNSINYKYRMHDPRLGRFFAVDPLIRNYPFYSSYAFSGNRVLDAVEQEGLQPTIYTRMLDRRFSKASTSVVTSEEIVAGQIILGFTPIAPVIDLWDLGIAIADGDALGIGIAALGFIPFGDFAKVPGKIRKLTSGAANARHIKAGNFGPYRRGSEVLEFSTEQTETFKRVYSSDGYGEGVENARGAFMMKEADLLDANGNMLSPEAIQQKFALPGVPDKILDVEVPAGTTMRTGIAGAKPSFSNSPKGGGTQYELMDRIDPSSFKVKNSTDLK